MKLKQKWNEISLILCKSSGLEQNILSKKNATSVILVALAKIIRIYSLIAFIQYKNK